MVHPTVKALVARGLDSSAAERLQGAGWTISKLKGLTKDELRAVDLSDEVINLLFSEQRPRIPNDILSKLLFDNRFQCCVCRDPNQPIIVHHIVEWAKSRSHKPENLAVLCLNHHGDAHAKKSLSQNLDESTIRELKKKWESDVRRFDAESILSAMRLDFSSWNYINELRVFEIAVSLGVDFTKIRDFRNLVRHRVVRSDGFPNPVSDNNLYYMYEGPNLLPRYFYTSEVLSRVIENVPIVNISDWFDKGVLGVALAAGDFVFVQGAHTFSPTTGKKSGQGRGQFCIGYRSANHVEIRFTFDRWEATSSSAKNEWLCGTKNQGSFVHVKDLSRQNNKLIITGTVLGICSNSGGLKKRDYAVSLYESGNFKGSFVDLSDYDENDGDAFDGEPECA